MLLLRDRERPWAWEGRRERETQNLKQAPGSQLSVQSPMRSSNPGAMRSWPEPKSEASPTEPPRRPLPDFSWVNLYPYFFCWMTQANLVSLSNLIACLVLQSGLHLYPLICSLGSHLKLRHCQKQCGFNSTPTGVIFPKYSPIIQVLRSVSSSWPTPAILACFFSIFLTFARFLYPLAIEALVELWESPFNLVCKYPLH